MVYLGTERFHHNDYIGPREKTPSILQSYGGAYAGQMCRVAAVAHRLEQGCVTYWRRLISATSPSAASILSTIQGLRHDFISLSTRLLNSNVSLLCTHMFLAPVPNLSLITCYIMFTSNFCLCLLLSILLLSQASAFAPGGRCGPAHGNAVCDADQGCCSVNGYCGITEA